ncbi:DNA polymerase [Enterococcus phage vB_EfaP_IME199]|uniref:DNA-directed DNA polymerase n=1 Tax=Enterococcus phage vB_EfaP_IME199 TaxID=1747351 RepID=A0A0S2MYH8_9CAUD|nr:DNA polymerase [Enterococcus phage vB_EfaP_IME199]ALO81005.1 DNA polymerase [Enterococcus phage vB_EfaP_IME199]
MKFVQWLDNTTEDDLIKYLKKSKTHHFDIDIETFSYNMKMNRKAPTLMKSRMFTFTASWYDETGRIYTMSTPSIKFFIDDYLLPYAGKSKGKSKRSGFKRVNFYVHNGNKFDNHFLAKEIHETYQANYKNWEDDKSKVKINLGKHMTKGETTENYILEKRVKGMSHLSFSAVIQDLQIDTYDTVMKTGCSLAVCGEMLKSAGCITEDKLKTSFDYSKYHYQEDMTDLEAEVLALNLFQDLSEEEWIYIANDTYILSSLRRDFDKIFPGFDFKKQTKTQNIINAYKRNRLAEYQILGKITVQGETDLRPEIYEVNYSDYEVQGENLAKIIQNFYKGGLNFYNQEYVGKLLTGEFISFDINSSYPSIMYEFPMPFLIRNHYEHPCIKKVSTNLYEEFTLYKLTKVTFNRILDLINSRVVKQMLTKYFRREGEFVYVTTWTFKMLKENFHIDISEIECEQWFEFSVEYFGARDAITEFYFTKTQGKAKNVVEFVDNNPMNIIVHKDQTNEKVFTKQMIDIAKVNLNGIYGAPALKPAYSIGYRDEDGHLHVQRNGYLNTERNAMTSVFTTGGALWRLTQPLQYLTSEEIDDAFLYCDTDSLYMKRYILQKLPKEMFHPMNLGSWDIEHNLITEFYVLNHKKYAFYDNGIVFHCGGIPETAFNTDMTFKQFIDLQFNKGVSMPNNRSINTKEGTVVIYESSTTLDEGGKYPTNYTDEDELIEQYVKNKMREQLDKEDDNDMLYIEYELGSMALKDVYPFEYETGKESLAGLYYDSGDIRNNIS